MLDIIVEKPYTFIPPHRGTWWFRFIQRFNLYGRRLRQKEGVVGFECRHQQRLTESLQAGHGILLTPNHSRVADPLVMGFLAREVNCFLYSMASWHLFNQDWFTAFAIRRMGGFSVNREGVDRQAINTAIDILRTAERPLIIFPEGSTTRTNDRLHALLDGISFIARAAAKKRLKDNGGKVVVHPIGLKYLFGGDILQAVDDVLTEIEHRLSWRPQRDLSMLGRIRKVGQALLCLKELEFFGQPKDGNLGLRLENLIDRLLNPLEQEWLDSPKEGAVVPRVKALRMKIMPDMVSGGITEQERQRRWDQLADIYLAQQVSCYSPDYLPSHPSVDRVLETIERFEEDLTDKVRVHGSLKVIIEVGEAIEVSPKRDRKAEADPLMLEIEHNLQGMLDRLSLESPHFEAATGGKKFSQSWTK